MKAKEICPKIAWSKADRAWVGSALPLIGPCCHGKSRGEVAVALAGIIKDLVCDLCPHACLDSQMSIEERISRSLGTIEEARKSPGKRFEEMVRIGLINRDGSLCRRPRRQIVLGELMLEDTVWWANHALRKAARGKPKGAVARNLKLLRASLPKIRLGR